MNNRPTSIARPSVEIYTDGGCEPNPGPGGYGAVLVHPKKRSEVSGGFRKTANNQMEIFAAIAGLELLKQCCKVTLFSDSHSGEGHDGGLGSGLEKEKLVPYQD